MNTQSQDILDEEYKEALQELQTSWEVFSEEDWKIRSLMILKKARESLSKLF